MIGKSKLFFITVIATGALAATAAIWAPAAVAKPVVLNSSLVNLGVDVNGDGASVGAGVGDANVDVEAGVGDDGVNAGVDVGIGDTAASIDVGVGGGESGGGSDGGSGGGSGDPGGGANASPGTQDGDSPSGGGNDDKPASGNDGGTAGARPASGAAASKQADGAAGDGVPGASDTGAAGDGDGGGSADDGSGNERRSTIERIVAYVPDWVWIALAAMLLFCLAVGAFSWRERRRRQAAERNAAVDPLTGAANLKAFNARFDEEMGRARRHERTLGLMMIDLDGFKQVNDEHGHAAGDDVLIELAAQLQSHLRTSDLVARVGGDEFAVILPETGMRGLVGLRETLEARLPETIGHDVGVSVGIAELRKTDTGPDDVLKRADRSMYRRKRKHRDASVTAITAANVEPPLVSASTAP